MLTEDNYSNVDPGQALTELLNSGTVTGELKVEAPKVVDNTPAVLGTAPAELTPKKEETTDNTALTGFEAAQTTTTDTTGNSVTVGDLPNGDGITDTTQQATNEPLKIDPHMPVILKDGSVAAWHEIEAGSMLKKRYDQQRTELDKERAELEEGRQLVAASMPYLTVAQEDTFASVYLTAKTRGANSVQALEAALAAANISLPNGTASPTQGSTTQTSTPAAQLSEQDRYYAELPSTIEPGTVEYDKWYAQHLKLMSRMGAEEANRKMMDQQAQRDAQRQQQEQADRAKTELTQKQLQERTQRVEANKARMREVNRFLKEERGIDVQTLADTDRAQLYSQLDSLAISQGLHVSDESWLAANDITESQLRYLTLKATLPTTSQATTKPADKPPVVPTLTQSKVDLAVHKPIIPGQPSDGAAPVAPVELRDDRAVEGALQELFSSRS